MRTISKRTVPNQLVQWRQERIAKADPVGYPFDYDEMRKNKTVLAKVEQGLISEQGGLCAYTGHKISKEGRVEGQAGFHIEHLKPQDYCVTGEDCDYQNMVACWPEPNQKQGTPYGAVLKDNWPKPEETNQFVSPLRPDCSRRFRFVVKKNDHDSASKESVWIESARDNDDAASSTIEKLNLNHHTLRSLRWEAVRGALNPPGKLYLKLSELEKKAREMDKNEQDLNDGRSVVLSPFCFAVRQILDRQILKRRAANHQ